MKRIYSVLVENRAGVLSKVAGLFSRRNFNIDSMVVGETADKAVSCMTIVSTGDERTIAQVVLVGAFETNAVGIFLDTLAVLHAILELPFELGAIP